MTKLIKGLPPGEELTPEQVMSFLRSCAASGEQLSKADQETVAKAMVEVSRMREANRYALAVFRALDLYVYEDSDHDLLIKEAVKKLEAA